MNGGGTEPPAFENEFGDAPTGNASGASDEAEATPGAAVSVASRSASYTYDRGGNRTSQTVGGVTTNYTYNSGSQLVSESGGGKSVDHDYDTWGNEVDRTISESGTTTVETYGYNYHNRMSNYLRTVNGNVVAQWSYQFWASGERAGKTNLATTVGELYATRGDNVVTDYTRSPQGMISHANTYAQGLGLDQKSLRIPASGGRIHYVGDLVGTIAQTLTDSGMKSEECIRDIWGLALAGDTDNERYGFAQREHDMESGLVFNRARMYDSKIGRFTQMDPLVENRPAAHYTYASNMPTIAADPTGLITIIVHGTYSKESTWWRDTGAFAKSLDAGLAMFGSVSDVWKISTGGGKSVADVDELKDLGGPNGMFVWSGDNSAKAREEGAVALKKYIDAVKKKYPKEPIRVVAHSHGGNVAKRASALGAKMDALVLISTPHGENTGKKVEDPERCLYAPDLANVTGNILNLWNEQDVIQDAAASAFGEGDSVKFSKTDGNPKLRGRIVNGKVNVWCTDRRFAHSVMHCSQMGTAIAQYIATTKITLPKILSDDSKSGD